MSRFLNRNSFPLAIEIDDGSLRKKKLPLKLLLQAHETHWAYLDYVPLDPPITPRPVESEARYVIHYGRDDSKPLDKRLVIKGHISGAMSADGEVGGFDFIPESEFDRSYVHMNCYVPPENYYLANN
jgi:hypothetical protein